jgi:peptidyl-prolyl cis-trans isomerase C
MLFPITAASVEADTPAQPARAQPGDIAAVVNGIVISEPMVELWTRRGLGKGSDSPEQQRQSVLDVLVSREVVVQEAQREGLDQDPQLLLQIEDQRQNLLAKAWAERWAEANPPSEDELRKAYEQRLVAAAEPEYRARHIMTRTKEEAQAAIEELKGGADFVEVSKRRSQDPAAAEGGELGWFSRGTVPDPIVEAAAGLEPGRFTLEPVQSNYGWHVLLLEETRKSPVPSFEQARADLLAELQSERLQARIRELKEKASVETR